MSKDASQVFDRIIREYRKAKKHKNDGEELKAAPTPLNCGAFWLNSLNNTLYVCAADKDGDLFWRPLPGDGPDDLWI